jgi:N-acetylglutamate synthase-like GNAT family acetyltransferase
MAAEFQQSLASPRDADAIKRLLGASGLPFDDIDPHLGDFIVARSSGDLVGVVGLEVMGDAALLRSLAVREDQRRHGLGLALCNEILARAQQRGVKNVYLLTLTAADFFRRKFSFAAVDRGAAPRAVQATHEFRSACPASASLLTKEL